MLLYISLGCSFLIMIITLLLIPESPKYLHATAQFDKCRDALKYMARMNGMSMSNIEKLRFSQELAITNNS